MRPTPALKGRAKVITPLRGESVSIGLNYFLRQSLLKRTFYSSLTDHYSLRILVLPFPSANDRTSRRYVAGARCDARAGPSERAHASRSENAPSPWGFCDTSKRETSLRRRRKSACANRLRRE